MEPNGKDPKILLHPDPYPQTLEGGECSINPGTKETLI